MRTIAQRMLHLAGVWRCARQGKVVLSHEELSLLLGGIDLAKTKSKRWYRKVNAEGDAAA
jgi:hypothetical protein